MLPFLALPQKSNQKKSRQNEASTHWANAGPPFCLANPARKEFIEGVKKMAAGQLISCPSRKRTGLVKITIVFNREGEDVMMG